MARNGFVAVVETGSCSMGVVPPRWETRATCGHVHRTYDAAVACGEKLRAYNPKTRTCSGLWAYPRIHDTEGHRV
jgi:hypothetical protein